MYCYYPTATAPAYTRHGCDPLVLIVILFILLIIVGAVCWC
ncbi:YjcZ family sporulation protein [Bacillus solimangrovi]|nr:YjcZ family sporulation protein [Bacillus solimangrovi]